MKIDKETRVVIEKLLAADNFQEALNVIMTQWQAPIGSLHRMKPKENTLELLAQKGVPPAVLEKIRLVPVGKGMAGLAASRKQPTSTCDLQTDAQAPILPMAKQTGAKGSICVPLLKGLEVKGTLGIAKQETYSFSPEETQALLEIGTIIAQYL